MVITTRAVEKTNDNAAVIMHGLAVGWEHSNKCLTCRRRPSYGTALNETAKSRTHVGILHVEHIDYQLQTHNFIVK